MKKFTSSLVLALAIVGIPFSVGTLTGCTEDNTAKQIKGVEEKHAPDHDKTFEEEMKKEDKPPEDM